MQTAPAAPLGAHGNTWRDVPAGEHQGEMLMGSLLIVSNIVLWISVLALALFVYALTRQVASLFDRIAPAGALSLNPVLKAGDVAPVVEVEDLAGKRLTLGCASAPRANPKSTLIVFVAPDCPISRTLPPVLRSVAKSESWLNIVLASDGGAVDEHRAFADEHRLAEFPYVLSRRLGETYGIGKLPYGVLIDEQGAIAALGLVNSREHIESLFEAKEQNVPTVQEFVRRQDRQANQTSAFYNAQPGGINQ